MIITYYTSIQRINCHTRIIAQQQALQNDLQEKLRKSGSLFSTIVSLDSYIRIMIHGLHAKANRPFDGLYVWQLCAQYWCKGGRVTQQNSKRPLGRCTESRVLPHSSFLSLLALLFKVNEEEETAVAAKKKWIQSHCCYCYCNCFHCYRNNVTTEKTATTIPADKKHQFTMNEKVRSIHSKNGNSLFKVLQKNP